MPELALTAGPLDGPEPTGRNGMRLAPLAPPEMQPEGEEGREKTGRGEALLAGNSVVALVAGPFSVEVARIWPGGRIGEYLAAPDGRRHVWHACLAAEKSGFRADDRAALEAAYARFTTWKGRDLVARALGRVPNAILFLTGGLHWALEHMYDNCGRTLKGTFHTVKIEGLDIPMVQTWHPGNRVQSQVNLAKARADAVTYLKVQLGI